MACDYCVVCGMPLGWDDDICPRCGTPKKEDWMNIMLFMWIKKGEF